MERTKPGARFWTAMLIFGLMGQVAWGVSIVSFAWIKSIWLTIVMDCVMTFFGSTANDAAYSAWLTDRGDETNRGRIEGLNSMMPLISILVVFGGFMGFDLDSASSWKTIYCIIGAATAVIGVLGFFLIEDAPCGFRAFHGGEGGIRSQKSENYTTFMV